MTAIAKNTTLTIMGSMWTIPGIILLSLGSLSLIGSANVQGLGFYVVAALAIGALKGSFVLARSAKRSLAIAKDLEDTQENILLGWYKALGWKGLLLIALMVLLGVTLGNWLDANGQALFRSLLRLTIGSALLIGSTIFWRGIASSAEPA